jgi:Fe-S oxidoreductase
MAGVDFAILGKEEKCNGDPARRAGNEYLAQMLIQENVATLAKYSPRKILAACPHCFNTLKNEYPEFGARYDVVHHSKFLLDLVDAGKIPMGEKSEETITYHDSCYLGRWNGVYEAPRALLSRAGVKIDEVKRSGEQGLCCGAGGARMFLEENIGKRVNVERTEELLEKKTKTIAANCPFCTTMITDGLKAKDKQADVMIKDIAEILLEKTRRPGA